MTQSGNLCESDEVDTLNDVLKVAERIEKYLANRAGAADTLDGVIHWWLMQQRVIEEEALVEKAISYLRNQGKIEQKRLPDGTDLFYCSNGVSESTHQEPNTEIENGSVHSS